MIGSIAAHRKPKVGFHATRTRDAWVATIEHMSIRETLAENLIALMSATPECGTEKLLRKRAKVGGGTVDGARQAKSAVTLDSLDKLAKAFGLEAWQLLVPNLNPRNRPVIHLTESERHFYARLETQIRTLQQELAQYIVEKTVVKTP
jgi:hypothetical protein